MYRLRRGGASHSGVSTCRWTWEGWSDRAVRGLLPGRVPGATSSRSRTYRRHQRGRGPRSRRDDRRTPTVESAERLRRRPGLGPSSGAQPIGLALASPRLRAASPPPTCSAQATKRARACVLERRAVDSDPSVVEATVRSRDSLVVGHRVVDDRGRRRNNRGSHDTERHRTEDGANDRRFRGDRATRCAHNRTCWTDQTGFDSRGHRR